MFMTQWSTRFQLARIVNAKEKETTSGKLHLRCYSTGDERSWPVNGTEWKYTHTHTHARACESNIKISLMHEFLCAVVFKSRPFAFGAGSVWWCGAYSISILYHRGVFFLGAFLLLFRYGFSRFTILNRAKCSLKKAASFVLMRQLRRKKECERTTKEGSIEQNTTVLKHFFAVFLREKVCLWFQHLLEVEGVKCKIATCSNVPIVCLWSGVFRPFNMLMRLIGCVLWTIFLIIFLLFIFVSFCKV